jgi:hypothetical protein
LPIETLNAHPVEFTLVSHSRIVHQDDDVAEKLKGSPSPGVGLSSFEQLPFWVHHQGRGIDRMPVVGFSSESTTTRFFEFALMTQGC